MTRLRSIVLAGLAILAASPVYADGVRVIRPPHRDPAAPTESRVVEERQPVQVQIGIVVLGDFDSRRARVDRALFQRWTGFVRQYSGRRYPF